MSTLEVPPNPGSREAIALGCHCSVIDNNRGLYPPLPPDDWWITDSCPLHGSRPVAPWGMP